jgi:hypothetical protein
VGVSSNGHLGRKTAGVDAEVNERVDDDSTNERGGHDYYNFQTKRTHALSPSLRGLSIKSGDSKKTSRLVPELTRAARAFSLTSEFRCG